MLRSVMSHSRRSMRCEPRTWEWPGSNEGSLEPCRELSCKQPVYIGSRYYSGTHIRSTARDCVPVATTSHRVTNQTIRWPYRPREVHGEKRHSSDALASYAAAKA